MGPHELLKTSWVYSLKKEELTAYLVQCGQDPTGTVDEMRKRLAKFITTDHDEDMTKKLLGWQKYHDQSNLGSPSVALRVPGEKTEGLKPQVSREVALDNPPRVMPESDSEKPPAAAVKEDRVATIELIRKWGLKYDGGKEVLKFADRLEELAGIYEVDLSAVLPVMCELLKDRALVWFRNNHQPWEHWSHFKKDLLDFFLPPRYFEKLELEVRSRTQRPRENFKEYLLALQELMYHANMSEGEKLEIIFRNSSPDYQWYIRRRDFKTLKDLVSLATELESIPTTRQPGRSEHHRMLRDQHSSPTDPTSPYQHPTHLAWKEEKITATIVVNHQPCDAIVDTGATRSFVTPAFVKKLQRKPERTPSDVEVTLADGSKRRISTAVQVPVTFGRLTKNHEFLVMKEATEAIILGLDFLKAFDTSIHCAGLTAKGEAADSEIPGKDAPQTQVKKHAYIYSCYNIRQPEEDGIQKRLKRFLGVELPKFDKIQDLSRHPMVEINLVQVRPTNSCPWYDGKVEAVRKSPELHADYTLVDNKLYRHSTREVNDVDTTPWKLCVPKYQRQRVLEEAHDQVTGGHMGVRKTINKIAGCYYWPGLARDVSRYVRRCDICQKYKTSQQQPAGKMLTRIQEEPWSLLCADFIGPLPRTAHGNTMLLVLFDNFSKWVELIPCRKATAEGVVRAIRERIVSRYGVPKALITDNGTQFTSRVLRRYLEEVGIKQQFTAPYTPQENPTERANRTIKTMIAQFPGERHNRWDELLPEVMLALNTSTSESTGYSPAFLTQGRNPRLPKALYDEVTIGTGAQCVSPEERADELKDIFKIVRNNMEKASQKQRHHYNLRRRNWSPNIGDYVLVRQHLLSKAVDNFTAKLAPKFKGPYVVTDFVSPVIVRVRNTGNNEKLTAHVSELKPYQSNNFSFSLISSKTLKSTSGQEGVTMESNRKKFERTKQQFRHNLKRENEKARRTRFLEDDEGPCSSSSRTTRRTNPAQSRQKVGSRKVQKEKCFRMTVTSPDKTPQRKTKLIVTQDQPPEHTPPHMHTITIPDRPTLEQLPEDIRKTITEVSKARKETRTRFRQEIWGHTYRVTINRDGEVLINRI